MATRHNLCPNPAASNDNTGWTSNSTAPARVDATGLGFPRNTAVHYTAGSAAFGPQAAATPGLAYTVSVYVRPVNFPINGTLFIEWLNSSGASISFEGVAFSAPDGVVTRISQSGVAAADTVSVHFVVSGENYASNPAYYTAHLAEQSATLLDYFDGDSPNASWDGAPGNSTSTLNDAATPAGTLTAGLPPATATFDASVAVDSALAGQLPGLAATATASVEVVGESHATLPSAEAALTGLVEAEGQIGAELPAAAATLAGGIEARAGLSAALPALAAELSGQVAAAPQSVVAAGLPALGASLTGEVTEMREGVLAAVMPAVGATLTGVSDAVEPDLPPLIVGPPRLAWPSGRSRLDWPAGSLRLGGE